MATLKVIVHEARDLPIMDRTTGLADPYVVVKLDDLECTTEIVHMSRHPVWDKVFRLDTPDLLILQEDPLEVRLYDHDIIRRDEIVGHTFVDCNSMVLHGNPSMSGWFPLFDTSAGGIRGEIRLTVKIKFHTAENPLAPRLPIRYVRRPPPVELEYSNRGEEPQSLTIPSLLHQVDGLEPLKATRMQHPSLTAEDEGVIIFSAWRLDPSVYRVESVRTMVEELILKADPEHSKLTNLRSTRTTNEARIIQLYKLSGKVRRQLARKVVEMQCNAVLGYVEEFDMESNGIIVRAYGTPCVLSAVRFVEQEKAEQLPHSNTQLTAKPADTTPIHMPSGLGSFSLPPETPFADAAVQVGNGSCVMSQIADADVHASVSQQQSGGVNVNPSVMPSPLEKHLMLPAHYNLSLALLKKGDNCTTELKSPRSVNGARTNVLILTLKDLPSGMVKHIGGHISARSVKIVAKMRSKQMISQERDAWWMELREELKANARAFYCNVILGYEEVVLYHEDVAVLSLFGTAVVLNLTMHPLRCGPEYLFEHARRRFAGNKRCSLLHLYSHRLASHGIAEELGEITMCNICHRRSVPEVLLMSCTIPPDLSIDGQPRLVQAVVSRAKTAVRGVGLALAVSQALPYIEYSLHKQLLFNLKLQQLNAVFGIRITICISPDTIIGSLTGTGCRLVGLPVPSPPRVEVLDPAIRRNEAVMCLESMMGHRKGMRRSHHRNHTLVGMQQGSISSLESLENHMNDTISSATWVDEASGTDSGSDQRQYGIERHAKVADYVVKIDDEEEAEMMLGMIRNLKFEDNLLLTIPYVPEAVNTCWSQERIVLNRRFALARAHNGSGSIETVNECFADAKRAYVQTVCRVALRHRRVPLKQLCVTNFTFDYFFEPNSGALHLRLEGCLMMSTALQCERLLKLEEQSFKECLRYLEVDSRPVQVAYHSSGGDSTTAEGSNNTPLCGPGRPGRLTRQNIERSIFVTSNAPYALPFVFKREVPPYTLRLNEDTSAVAFSLPDVHGCYKDNKARPGMIGRQWQALTSLASTAMRNLIEKTHVTSDGKGGVDSRHRDNVSGLKSITSSGDGPMLHQPMRRLPADLDAFEASHVGVIFTPLDFVAGQAIVRYVGRLSQHFIREAYEIDTSNKLGVFFQKTEFEMQCMVQAMVRLMGGNALLKHRVTYQEVWDSDGSGCAFVFVTVTGDVVQMSSIPLVPLVSEQDGSGIGRNVYSRDDEDDDDDDVFY